MKKALKNICDGIKKDVAPEHADFKYTLMWCGGITITTLLSLFWVWPVWLTLALCAGCILTSKGGRAVYVLIFILPLSYIFKLSPTDHTLRVYVMTLIVAILGIKYLIRVIQKKEKIEWLPTVLCVVLIVIFCLPFTFDHVSTNAYVIQSSLLLYLLWIYRKDINLREIFVLFLLGIAVSVLFGIPVHAGGLRASEYVIVDKNFVRYTGLYINPLLLTLEALICLAILFVLCLNDSMKYLYYLVFPFLLVCIIISGSKAGQIIFFISLVTFLLCYIQKSIKNKCKKNTIVVFCAITIAICAICMFAFKVVIVEMYGRFSNIITEPSVGTPPGIGEPGIGDPSIGDPSISDPNIEVDGFTKFMDNLTTYRYSIWISYLRVIFNDFWHMLFGFGLGAPFVGTYPYTQANNIEPHSTFIEVLFFIGVLGTIVIIAWALALAIPLFKQKKINWRNVIVLIFSFGLCLVFQETFTNLLAVYLIIVLPCVTYRNKPCDKVSSVSADAGRVIKKTIRKTKVKNN